MPQFFWQYPGPSYRPKYMVSGIKWQASLDIKSMSCRYSGAYMCMSYNSLGKEFSSTAIVEVSGLCLDLRSLF